MTHSRRSQSEKLVVSRGRDTSIFPCRHVPLYTCSVRRRAQGPASRGRASPAGAWGGGARAAGVARELAYSRETGRGNSRGGGGGGGREGAPSRLPTRARPCRAVGRTATRPRTCAQWRARVGRGARRAGVGGGRVRQGASPTYLSLPPTPQRAVPLP